MSAGSCDERLRPGLRVDCVAGEYRLGKVHFCMAFVAVILRWEWERELNGGGRCQRRMPVVVRVLSSDNVLGVGKAR